MAKFHLSEDGVPRKCRAFAGNCPLQHADKPEDLRATYEASRGNDTFANTVSKAESQEVKNQKALDRLEAHENKWREVSHWLDDNTMKAALIGGAVTGILLGGGLMYHTNTQSYDAVQATATSSTVDHYTTVSHVGKVTTIQNHTDTEVRFTTPSGEHGKVTIAGDHHKSEGDQLTVYETSHGHFTDTKPGSVGANLEAAAIGAAGGMGGGILVGLATMGGAMASESRQYSVRLKASKMRDKIYGTRYSYSAY